MSFFLQVLGDCNRNALIIRYESIYRLRKGDGLEVTLKGSDFLSIFNSHSLLAWFKFVSPLMNTWVSNIFCWNIELGCRCIDALSFAYGCCRPCDYLVVTQVSLVGFCCPISFTRFHSLFRAKLEPKCEVFLLVIDHILLVVELKKLLAFFVCLCPLLNKVALSIEMCRSLMLHWVRAFNIPVGFLYLLLEQLFLLIRMRSVADLLKKHIQRLLLCGVREDLLWLANHHRIRSSP